MSTSDVPVAKVATAQIISTVSAPAKNPVAAIVLTVLSWLGWSPRAATAAAFPAVPTPWAVLDWFRDAHPWYNRAPSVTVVTGPPDPTEETAGGQVVGVDPEHDDLSYAVSRDARYGTVSIDSVTGQFTYTVADPTAQADSFAVAVDDGHRAGTAVVVVSVDLSGVPEARKVDVVAGHSTLAIPCGDGCTVPADWYFPTGAEAPNGVIWLQHGFIAGAGWYDKLATQLAEQTNSIVVAPTLSSNPLTSGGKWLNGDVMQHAVADLLADRTALTASAAAAAGHPVELPRPDRAGRPLGRRRTGGDGRGLPRMEQRRHRRHPRGGDVRRRPTRRRVADRAREAGRGQRPPGAADRRASVHLEQLRRRAPISWSRPAPIASTGCGWPTAATSTPCRPRTR